jgi:hypothetical protein
LGVLLGAGAGLHMTAILLTPGLLVLLWPRLRTRFGARLLPLGIGVLAGLSVYAYVPMAARGGSPVNWGDARTLSGMWWVIGGAPYRGYLFGVQVQYLPQRLGAWLALWRQQYGVIGLGLAFWGLCLWFERSLRRALATMLVFCAYTVVAVTYDTTDSYVYLLPAHAVTALWIYWGAHGALDRLVERWPTPRASMVLPLLVLAIPAWSMVTNCRELNLSSDRSAERWVETTLQSLPPEALLVTTQDRHTFALSYAQWVEGSRPDVRVVDADLLQYSWYVRQITRRWSILEGHAGPVLVADVLAEHLSARPAFLDAPREDVADDCQVVKRGPVWQIVPAARPG